ncbi:hypothetical protein FGIG_03523 [Fasciola gigantica]|uniref:Uncharacterized protein n=1 Tax=Fasciola gigantica TaxID=46835 RepID=A0A504YQB2_FASGI|nr:hypothetical protein FGIG_03523 [Fasciola gigantica]
MILFYAFLFSLLSNSLWSVSVEGILYNNSTVNNSTTTVNSSEFTQHICHLMLTTGDMTVSKTWIIFLSCMHDVAFWKHGSYVLGALYLNKKAASITTDMKRSGTEAHKKLQDELCASVSKGFNTDSLLATSLLQCQISQVGNHDVETALDFNGNNLKLNNLDVRDKALQKRIKNAILSYTPSAYYYYGSISQVNGK